MISGASVTGISEFQDSVFPVWKDGRHVCRFTARLLTRRAAVTRPLQANKGLRRGMKPRHPCQVADSKECEKWNALSQLSISRRAHDRASRNGFWLSVM
jgi:hypothetical protein